ncbi:toxin-antitoxin system YwqK family antitoxin [Chryseobacterium daecheongense]|uniref:Toxin-antitoxin system YwqK family antitoxin n=1 Tax=Chryseobacterium daecheongense TaxID=192389 RepID=A0A3N0VSV2_9FLAO|nr:hypothetical protein [Chryseobacterium daecheongense]ROH95899.1 hypothetical protein EGI05_15385 [Chryseobacterium daecheongense]TDX91703.1 hypothetical protein BCF50_2841 [Chryseobacterium daecheongense]
MSQIIKIYNAEDEDNIFEFKGVDNAGGVIYYYEGKPFTGIIQHYSKNIMVGEEEFTDGHIGGVQREYYENGQIKEEYYKYFGKLDKYYKEWDINGNLIRHSIWQNGTKIQTIIQ